MSNSEAALPASVEEWTDWIAGQFATLLSVPGVKAHDDFFDLGGDSLKAGRFVGSLYTACGVRLPIDILFERPTPAELAPLVHEALTERP